MRRRFFCSLPSTDRSVDRIIIVRPKDGDHQMPGCSENASWFMRVQSSIGTGHALSLGSSLIFLPPFLSPPTNPCNPSPGARCCSSKFKDNEASEGGLRNWTEAGESELGRGFSPCEPARLRPPPWLRTRPAKKKVANEMLDSRLH